MISHSPVRAGHLAIADPTLMQLIMPTAAEILAARRRGQRKAVLIAVLAVTAYWGLVVAAGSLLVRLVCAAVLIVAVVATATSVITTPMTCADSLRPIEPRLGHSADLLGTGSWMWRFEHNRLHHGNTNIVTVDSDLSQAPFARLAPGQPWRPWHARLVRHSAISEQCRFKFLEMCCQFCPNRRTMRAAARSSEFAGGPRALERIRHVAASGAVPGAPLAHGEGDERRQIRVGVHRRCNDPTKEAPCLTRYQRTNVETNRSLKDKSVARTARTMDSRSLLRSRSAPRGPRSESPSGGAGAASRCSRVIRLENRPQHRSGGSVTRATTSCSEQSFGRRDAEVPMECAATGRPRARPRRRRPQTRASRRSRCSHRHSAIRSRRGHPVHDRNTSGPPCSPRQVRRPFRSH